MIRQFDLSGTWKLRWSDGQRGRAEDAAASFARATNAGTAASAAYRWIDARVPGEVHLDLIRQGWIAEPTIGNHVLAARWVEECYWHYRNDFDVPAEVLEARRAWLVFDGLDLAAIISLNGAEIARHRNAFYPCRTDVTGKLRPGHNCVCVQIEGGLWDAADKPAEQWLHWPDQRLNKRHWLRKPQFQFGWDWAPRLINVGIFKPVRLEWTNEPARIAQAVPLIDVVADLKSASVRVRLFVENMCEEPLAATIAAQLADDAGSASQEVTLQPGLHAYEVRLNVNNPRLWWPRGHGEQNLYALNVRLIVAGQALDERNMRIGFRSVRIDQSPHPSGAGRWFTIEINGRKIFARGANWVPSDIILSRIDRARYQRLLEMAVDANFNFLRVWGGGLYESEDFYELSDELGILVWQEFAFACSRYPTTDQAFFEDIKREAIHNIRRLAPHPSLILWCGNNEVEWGDWDWDYGRVGQIMPDHGFFHIALPRLLSEEDPTRPYHPSSPYSPDGLHPQDFSAGDQHPWGVGFFNNDFREYRKMTCRFASEGGTLGPTSLPTMNACLPPDQRHIGSLAWQVHDNAVATWTDPSVIDQMTQQWLGRDVSTMSIDEFAYWGGLLQGEALRECCDNFRRRMFHDGSAAVFWMFNDCWPAVRSWTIVDYHLRRTPAFWAVRRAMSPIHVVVACEADRDEVEIYVINDTLEAFDGELSFGLFHLAGGARPFERRARVTAPPNASTRLASFPRAHWANPADSAAFAILRQGSHLVARNRLFLPMFKELTWPASHELNVTSVADGRVRFDSDTFIWGACLDLSGEMSLSDNFFDVYPGEAHEIRWTDPSPPHVLHVGNLTPQ